MTYARTKALQDANMQSANLKIRPIPQSSVLEFGSYVFNKNVMQKMLSREVFKNVTEAMEGKAKIKPEFADAIALAMKEWAISRGATHYTHWFQPLTEKSAEKHDAFLDRQGEEVIEKFTGKQLIQGEPDASSFPSGGLRSTYEARGYTGWDPTSLVFLWKAGDGMTLCIPSVFFSWTGEVLDAKIPFLRSEEKICNAVLRLLKMTGIEANAVYSTLGIEQEYFVIDRNFRNLRPDILLLGKTVLGAPSPKGQELQDHYLGSVKDRILAFMRDFENEAIKLAIPVKTRHNEVAPAQHEVAPLYEKSSQAIDHNILLMELMRHIAIRHDLSCLLNEKPFKGFNGSGKHCNWSLATDNGLNLLDPSDTPGNNLHFLILMAAILNAIYEYSGLIRASIGSYSNDFRLGGHEAPPAILSVYLGEELEKLFVAIEEQSETIPERKKMVYDLGLSVIPHLNKDTTDRNRTSPFAFTGNKFELRAVGSSAHPAFPITVLNLAIAESLNQILDDMAKHLKEGDQTSKEEFLEAAMPVIRNYLIKSKPIRFSGDNYSEAWKKEAEKRGLSNFVRSPEALEELKKEKTEKLFRGILKKEELESRYEVMKETYSASMLIEINLFIDLFRTQIFPASVEWQASLAKGVLDTSQALGSSNYLSEQIKLLKELTFLIEEAVQKIEDLEAFRANIQKMANQERHKILLEKGFTKCESLRRSLDLLETMVDDKRWPLPKYRELLFVL